MSSCQSVCVPSCMGSLSPRKWLPLLNLRKQGGEQVLPSSCPKNNLVILGIQILATKINSKLIAKRIAITHLAGWQQCLGPGQVPPGYPLVCPPLGPAMVAFSDIPFPTGLSSIPVPIRLLSLCCTLALSYRNSDVIFSHEVREKIWTGQGWGLPCSGESSSTEWVPGSG
jgi:hypothetical protein